MIKIDIEMPRNCMDCCFLRKDEELLPMREFGEDIYKQLYRCNWERLAYEKIMDEAEEDYDDDDSDFSITMEEGKRTRMKWCPLQEAEE